MNNKTEKEYITPFVYKFEFTNKSNPKDEKNEYVIMFEGREVKVDSNIVQFNSQKQLSVQQVVNKIKGTKGVFSISGTFKDFTYGLKFEKNE